MHEEAENPISALVVERLKQVNVIWGATKKGRAAQMNHFRQGSVIPQVFSSKNRG